MEALKVTVLGDAELVKKLDAVSAHSTHELLKLSRSASIAVERELRLNYSEGPLQARSNRLERSVTSFAEMRGKDIVAGAGTPVFYAEVLEHGAEIFPVEAEALVFQLSDGSWIATKHVTIPAFKAGEKAAAEAEPKVRQIYSDGINRFLDR